MDRSAVPGSAEVPYSQRPVPAACVSPTEWTPAQLTHAVCAIGFAWACTALGLQSAARFEPWLFAACFALGFDNAVLFCGAQIGPGRMLDWLSRARFFMYVGATPMLLSSIVGLAARCGLQDDLVSAMDKHHHGISGWLDQSSVDACSTVSTTMMVLFVGREVVGLVRGVPPSAFREAMQDGEGGIKGNPSAPRFGDCLASQAMLGGVFKLYSDGTILRYCPYPKRKHYTAPAGLALLASIWVGLNLWVEVGRSELFLGAGLSLLCRIAGSRLGNPLPNHIGEVLWLGSAVCLQTGALGVKRC